jgi:hypothetical protein
MKSPVNAASANLVDLIHLAAQQLADALPKLHLEHDFKTLTPFLRKYKWHQIIGTACPSDIALLVPPARENHATVLAVQAYFKPIIEMVEDPMRSNMTILRLIQSTG